METDIYADKGISCRHRGVFLARFWSWAAGHKRPLRLTWRALYGARTKRVLFILLLVYKGWDGVGGVGGCGRDAEMEARSETTIKYRGLGRK